MKLLKALFYKLYWKYRNEDDFNPSVCSYFAIGAITTVSLSVLLLFEMSLDVLRIKNLDSNEFSFKMIICWLVVFVILWAILIRKGRCKEIIENHELYDQPKYKHIVLIYAAIMVAIAFLAAYIGCTDNIARNKATLNM